MKSGATPRFWAAYRELPPEIREAARKAYRLFRGNIRHPSLQFKGPRSRFYWKRELRVHRSEAVGPEEERRIVAGDEVGRATRDQHAPTHPVDRIQHRFTWPRLANLLDYLTGWSVFELHARHFDFGETEIYHIGRDARKTMGELDDPFSDTSDGIIENRRVHLHSPSSRQWHALEHGGDVECQFEALGRADGVIVDELGDDCLGGPFYFPREDILGFRRVVPVGLGNLRN